MCEFCVKHGEGKKWYLNVKNYSYDLLNDIGRKRLIKNHFYWLDQVYKKYFNFLKSLPLNFPLIRPSTKAIVKHFFLYQHWGQVIPIEDIEKVLNFTNSITRVPCGCRMATAKKEYRVCFLISIDPNKVGIADIIDQSYFGGPDIAKFERVGITWALDFIKESETKGMIHTVWAFKAPFVGGICNCDFSTGCIPMKMYKEAVPVVFRAEYVGRIDVDQCVGCRECIKLCQFGAIEIDKITKKSKIDPRKCYGCGICRSVCKKNAISLKDRRSMPEAAHLW